MIGSLGQHYARHVSYLLYHLFVPDIGAFLIPVNSLIYGYVLSFLFFKQDKYSFELETANETNIDTLLYFQIKLKKVGSKGEEYISSETGHGDIPQ